MKITSDENVNQAVEQMVQAIRNTDAYLEYQKQLARVKEQSELKRQIDEFRTRNFELQTLKVAFAVIVVYLVYTGASTCYDYGYRIFTEPAISSGEGRKITVTLTSDMSATEIGNTLQEKGLVRDGRLFALQYLLSEYKKDWKPGTYELSTAMTAEEMMEVMAGQTESATEETVETIDNGSAITGETQDTTAVAQ